MGKFSLLFALCSFILVSCSQEEFLPQETDSDAVKISASIGKLQTRVSYDERNTTFDENDQIKVVNKLRTSKNVATYTLTDEEWNTADPFVWNGASKNEFEAWYPLTASYTTFTIPTDQSSEQLLGAADWMTASSGKIDKPENHTLNLNFHHQLSKVTVNIAKWNSEFDSSEKVIENLKIYSKGTDIEVVYATDGPNVTTSDGALTAITPSAVGHTYTAIVAPAKYATTDKFMTFTVNGQEMTVLATPSSLNEEGLQAGLHYLFNLKVGKDAATLYSVKVTPWSETEIDGGVAEDVTPTIDLSKYTDGETVNIAGGCWVVGDGNEYNIKLNITDDAIVTFAAGTGGVKLNGLITVADGKTLTLLVEGNAEHTVKGCISLGNGSNVIIEGDLTKENNKLTVTATGGNAGIGANNGVTAGNVTIRNARVDATGSSKEVSADSNMIIRADTSISGAAIGTSDGSMGDILIENSIIVAEGGYYENTSHAPAIGIGYVGSTMGNITLKDSQITAANNGDGLASVIGAGANHHVFVSGSLGDIVITNTELNLSMAVSTKNWYAAVIGSGIGFSHGYVNMGKIIFTDVTQAELDEMIPTWLPSDFNESQGYALGRGNDGSIYKYDAFGGVWVSDSNGGTVQIGDESGYYNPE